MNKKNIRSKKIFKELDTKTPALRQSGDMTIGRAMTMKSKDLTNQPKELNKFFN